MLLGVNSAKWVVVLMLLLVMVWADDEEHGDCSQCQRSNEGCDICFSNCTSLIFKSCQDNVRPMNESECIQNCCESTETRSAFDNDSLNQCLLKSGKAVWVRSAAYYAILGAGSLALFILVIIIIRAVYRRSQSGNVRPVRREHHLAQDNSFDHPSFNAMRPDEIINSKVYPLNCKDIIDDPTNSCCICLDGNVNAITKCAHVFHLNCLGSWAYRKNNCPLCNFADIHEAKLYCKTCKSQLQTIDFRKLRINQIQSLNNKLCEGCSK